MEAERIKPETEIMNTKEEKRPKKMNEMRIEMEVES